MSTLKGVFSVILLEVMYWLIPPNNDPAFMALAKPLQAFILASLLAVGVVAISLFAYGMAKDLTAAPSPADRLPGDGQ